MAVTVSHSELDIEIEVRTQYLAGESAPEIDKYVFIYEIKIFNCGNQPLQLLSRHWIITDGNQQVLEVEGSGVVGQQPRIEVGEFYEYTSGTVLETPIGTMHGKYDMVTDDGNSYVADIPEFSLIAPGQLH
jgi:ApaG protein